MYVLMKAVTGGGQRDGRLPRNCFQQIFILNVDPVDILRLEKHGSPKIFFSNDLGFDFTVCATISSKHTLANGD